MDFKITLGIYGAKSKKEVYERVSIMLDSYDLHNFSEVEINWLDTDEGEVKPI